ncbi:MAG: hypothetical protein QF811_01290 [Candidatus Woesearchaeota archaeon]|nr:hypothetical protein [Candidatus Woesearchaeota archaeon]
MIIVMALLAVLLIMDFVGEGAPTGQQVYSDHGCVGGDFAIYDFEDESLRDALKCVTIDGLETYKEIKGLRECDYSKSPRLYYQQLVDSSYTGDQGYGYLCSDSGCGDGNCDSGDWPIDGGKCISPPSDCSDMGAMIDMAENSENCPAEASQASDSICSCAMKTYNNDKANCDMEAMLDMNRLFELAPWLDGTSCQNMPARVGRDICSCAMKTYNNDKANCDMEAMLDMNRLFELAPWLDGTSCQNMPARVGRDICNCNESVALTLGVGVSCSSNSDCGIEETCVNPGKCDSFCSYFFGGTNPWAEIEVVASADPGDWPIEPHPEIEVVASADPGDWPIEPHPEIEVVT